MVLTWPLPSSLLFLLCNAIVTTYPTTLIAGVGAYVPEDTYLITDDSLPSYNVMNDMDLAKPTSSGGGPVNRPNAKKSTSPATKRTVSPEEAEARDLAKREKEIAKYKEFMAKKDAQREKDLAAKAQRQAMQNKRKSAAVASSSSE